MLASAAKLVHGVAILLAHGETHVQECLFQCLFEYTDSTWIAPFNAWDSTYYFIHVHILSLNVYDI